MKRLVTFFTISMILSVPAALATNYTGTYDIGGGAMHFSNPKQAIDSLRAVGNSMTGNVILNVYNGTYNQGVLSLYAITGLGTYNLTIQNAPGQNPVINNSAGIAVFDINRGENITISGIRTTSAPSGPVYYVRRPTSSGVVPNRITIRGNRVEVPGGTGVMITGYLGAPVFHDILVEKNYIKAATGISNNGGTAGNYNIVFSNNMIIATGICATQGYPTSAFPGSSWYFNTMRATRSGGICFQFGNTGYGLYPVTLQNNVFACDSSGSCLATGSGDIFFPPQNSTNNAFYAPLGMIASNGYIMFSTLVDYRTYCQQYGFPTESGSVMGVPWFVSATDVHIRTDMHSVIDGHGTPITGYTTDYDGQARDGSHPDIGADEHSVVGCTADTTVYLYPDQPIPGNQTSQICVELPLGEWWVTNVVIPCASSSNQPWVDLYGGCGYSGDLSCSPLEVSPWGLQWYPNSGWDYLTNPPRWTRGLVNLGSDACCATLWLRRISPSCSMEGPEVILPPDHFPFPSAQTTQVCANPVANQPFFVRVPVDNASNIPTVSVYPGCFDCGSGSTCEPIEDWNFFPDPGAWQFDPGPPASYVNLTFWWGGYPPWQCCVCFHLDSIGGDLRVTAPNGGEAWYIADSNSVTWTGGTAGQDIRIELSRDYPAGVWEFLATVPATDLLYTWPVTSPETSTARIRILSVSDSTKGDTSDANFTILVNHPPNEPSNPQPPDSADSVSIFAVLSWTGGDPEPGDIVTYDIYFGGTNPPPPVASNQSATSYDPVLHYDSTYYWQIVAHDNHAHTTVGPLWLFTTKANQPPNPPGSPSPADSATSVPEVVTLHWTATDPDTGDVLTYDLYFGTSNPPPWLVSGLSSASYTPDTLDFDSTYFWQVMVNDNFGHTNTGPIWRFTTSANQPPYPPSNPNPADGSTNVPVSQILSWTGGDPNPGDVVTYDVYLGTPYPPPLVSSGQSATSYDPFPDLDDSTNYFWKVVAHDNHDHSTESATTWSFATICGGVGGWSAQNSGTTATLNAVDCVDENNCWAVSASGLILHTTNGGVTWFTQPSGTTNSLNDVDFVDLNNGWIFGNSGTIRRTTDGGNTWTGQSSGTTSRFFAGAFADVNNGWAMGDYGLMRHTTNGGATWTSQSGTSYSLWGIAPRDPSNVWAVGYYGTILHTTNGGTNWTTQPSGTSQHLYGVAFAELNNGWVVGDAGTIRHTTDGGSTWTGQSSGATTILLEVAFVNTSIGWVVGYTGTIRYTTNGGSNWATQSGGTTQNLTDVKFVNANSGWATGGNGTILHYTAATSPSITVSSPNGGGTWYTGDLDSIRWTSLCLSENVKIELNRTYPAGPWETIAASAPNSGNYVWPVAGPATTTARIRVSGTVHPTVSDTSDADFAIVMNLPPDDLVITADSLHVHLNWNPAGSGLQYQVYCDSVSTGLFSTLLGTVSDTVFVDSNAVTLPPSTKFYIVRSYRP